MKDGGFNQTREVVQLVFAIHSLTDISGPEEIRRREELYKAIGYSEEEEFVEYPREVCCAS